MGCHRDPAAPGVGNTLRRLTWGLACGLPLVFSGVAAKAAELPAAAPLAPASVLRAVDLQSDAALLREAYQTLHPGLYRYRTRPEMDEAFEVLWP